MPQDDPAQPNLSLDAPSLRLKVNGRWYEPQSPPTTRLLDFLREELNLTGTKEGCGEGECGACLVLLNGELVNSCLVLIGQCDGQEVLTIEGLDALTIQQAFVDAAAIQCGFCTPGLIMATYALLQKNPQPDSAQIREALAGNLCRCTGYQKVIQAVQLAAERLKRR